MADSIAVETSADGLVVSIVVGASYSIFVERGTLYVAPQPFLTPAYAIVKPELIRALRNILKRHSYTLATVE
jgi:HK97 gp10 family phage protein